MGPIVKEFEKRYSKKIAFVTFYVDDESHARALASTGIRTVPTIRFIDKNNKIICQTTDCTAKTMKEQITRLLEAKTDTSSN